MGMMSMRAVTAVLVSLAVVGAAGGAEAAGKVLFDFEGGFAFEKIEARDAKVRGVADPGGGRRMRLELGHKQDWPGITLVPPGTRWDLSRYGHLAMEVRNVGDASATLCWRIDNPRADGVRNCITGHITLGAGESGTCTVALKSRTVPTQNGKPIRLFGMRGFPWNMHGAGGIDTKNVVGFILFAARPTKDSAFEIDKIRAGGTAQMGDVPEAFFPFIDKFGQYKHRDWPGKTHSEADLTRHKDAEAADLAAHAGPAGWDKYGGWAKGPTRKATGFFYPAKVEGTWWLIDPEGKLFWSHGIDCVHTRAATPIDDRDGWYDWLPDRTDPVFGGQFGRQGHVVRDYYKGKRPRTFDFGTATTIRKYGKDWRAIHGRLAHRRLRSWGLNTIANWSDPGIYRMRKTPYTPAIHFSSPLLEGSSGYWGKFRDVFDPAFARAIAGRMKQEAKTTAGDPWCLGYFIDNEISWGSETSLAEAALASPPAQTAKKVFLADLKATYGSIEKLNRAWKTTHADWDALLAARTPPSRKIPAVRRDLLAFSAKTADTYFRTIRQAVKAVAPNNLYLGCRFAWANKVAVAAAVTYCDVVSYNRYRDSVADFSLPVEADVPVIIGEFHFGALDRGMFHTGLRPTASQDARAKAYASYVRGALANPVLVGTGWFKYKDQSPTGRALDGENYQIGFLDICDTPYKETIAACREVGYNLYEYRSKGQHALADVATVNRPSGPGTYQRVASPGATSPGTLCRGGG